MAEQLNPGFKKGDDKLTKIEAEITLIQKKRNFDNKKQDLIKKIAERQAKMGTEDNIVNLLKMFLGISIKMEEFMDILQDMNQALSCLGDAIDFLDEALVMDNIILESSMIVEYTFITRIKQRYKTWRAMRNNRNRLKTIMENIKWKFKMAEEMVAMVDKMAVSLGKMSFSHKPKKKRKQASNEVNHIEGVEDLINDYMSKNNMVSNNVSSTPKSAPTMSKGGSKPSLSDDDISDILGGN